MCCSRISDFIGQPLAWVSISGLKIGHKFYSMEITISLIARMRNDI